MFQAIKRARFISKYNAPHVIGDLSRAHLWLQSNGWPANEMMDALIKYKESMRKDDHIFRVEFELFVNTQFLFVHDNGDNELNMLYENWINKPEFSRHMSLGLNKFFERLNNGSIRITNNL